MFSVLYPAFCIVMWPTMRRELDFCTLRTGTKKKRQTTRTFTRTEEEEKKNERHKRRKDWRRQKEKYNVAPQTCDFFLRRNNSEFADKDEAIDQKWKKGGIRILNMHDITRVSTTHFIRRRCHRCHAWIEQYESELDRKGIRIRAHMSQYMLSDEWPDTVGAIEWFLTLSVERISTGSGRCQNNEINFIPDWIAANVYPAAELWSKKSLFFYKDLEIFQKNVYPFTIIFALSLSFFLSYCIGLSNLYS